MPIYEFYCPRCHTVYNFLSNRIDTKTVPPCPRSGEHALRRKPASFAVRTRSAGDEGEDHPLLQGMDEQRMAGALQAMMEEMESAGDPDDPRQMAHFFRRFGEAAGLEPGPRMEEMLARLEAGEDPETLEEGLGDDLDGELEGMDEEAALAELFRLKRRAAARARKPQIDPEIYWF